MERGSLGSLTYVLCLTYVPSPCFFHSMVPPAHGSLYTAMRLGLRHTYHPRHLTPGRLGLPPYVSPSMPNAWTDLPLAPALCPLSTTQVLSSRRHCYSGVKDIPPCHSVYWTKLKHKYRVLVYVRSMLPCGVLVLGDSVNKPELFCEQSDLCRHFL